MQEWQAQWKKSGEDSVLRSNSSFSNRSNAKEDWHATQRDAYRRLSWMGVEIDSPKNYTGLWSLRASASCYRNLLSYEFFYVCSGAKWNWVPANF